MLNGLPARSLLLSHSDLHWNPSRYLRTCEHRRPDVEHVSLQLLPYPWFARQKRAYGNVSWPDVPPRPSTDVAADAYEVMLADAIAANLGGFPGGVQGRTRERNSQLQSLLSRPFSTRFG